MKRVLVSGFGWTGSSAIIDYIAEYEEAIGLRNDWEEGSLYKGPYSVASLYSKVRENGYLEEDHLCSVIEVLRGEEGIERSYPNKERMNIRRNQLIRGQFGSELIDELLESFRRQLMAKGELEECGNRIRVLPDDMVRLSRDLASALVESAPMYRRVPSASTCVFNNDPPAYAVDMWKLLGPDKVVVVTRDMCDAYATLVRMGRASDDVEGAARFVAEHKRKLARFRRLWGAGEYGVPQDSVRIYDFATFVRQDAVRKELAEWLGLSGRTRKTRLIPEESAENIGIGRKLRPEVQEMIERDLNHPRQEMLKGMLHGERVFDRSEEQ